jgi:hypothetical protein
MILEASVSDRVIFAAVAPHRLRRVAWTLLSIVAVLPGCVKESEELFPEPNFVPPNSTQSGDGIAPAPGGTAGPADADDGNTPGGVDPELAPEGSGGEAISAEGAGQVSEGTGDPALEGTPSIPSAEGAEATPPVAPAVEVDPTGQARDCRAPAQPLLLDFAQVNNGPSQTTFGDFNSVLSGGTYVYPMISGAASPEVPPPPGLTSDVTLGDWHIAGSVVEPAGFGLFLDCQRLDASLFQGVAFRIAGNVASTGSLQFLVGTVGNEVSHAWLLETNGSAPPSFGRCEPAVSQFDGTCNPPHLAVPVSPEPVDVFVSFATLSGGSPEPRLNPLEVVNIRWTLPDPALDELGNVTPYAVDLRIDDIRLVDVGAPTPDLTSSLPVTPEPIPGPVTEPVSPDPNEPAVAPE